MMREEELYFDDILTAIDKLIGYTESMSFNDFEKDEKTYDAVIRNLEVIGEAVGHLSEKTRGLRPDLPWTQMLGMRNKLIHEYFGISPKIVWATLQKDVPILRTAIKALRIVQEPIS